MNRETLSVELPGHGYPIVIGSGLLDATLKEHVTDREIFLITDTNVAPLYLERVSTAIHSCANLLETIALPAGEDSKSLDTVSNILDAMVKCGLARDGMIAALGGGVVGDISGFASSCYMRGVDFLQIPTTLLAQVDSSVGGKTGVNHPLGKNLIGTFHQPVGVIADIDTLETLDKRQFVAGLAEVIKYGLIADADFFAWLESNMQPLLARDSGTLMHAIYRCCEIKASIVCEDELESGRRAILNLGHTFGHAIEAGMGYGTWLHGEAVAAGISIAANMSRALGRLEAAAVERIRQLLLAAGLPIEAPTGLSAVNMVELMQHDKKTRQGRLHLVLLDAIGNPVITADFEPDILLASLRGR